jgi:hypothetical protein
VVPALVRCLCGDQAASFAGMSQSAVNIIIRG